MKLILTAIAGLLVSATAWACPDLTGSYTCTYEDGASEVLDISQSSANGVTTFTINGNSIPADGQVYQLPDDAYTKNYTMSYACEGTPAKLALTYGGDYYENGAFVATIAGKNLFSKDILGDLLIEDLGAATLADGSSFPWASSMSCVAN